MMPRLIGPSGRASSLRALASAGVLVVMAGCGGQPTGSRQPATTNPPSSGQPGSTSDPGASPAITPQPVGYSITLEPFATVPGGPLAMAALDDGTGRLLVASQDGTIWVVQADGSVAPNPMIDLAAQIRSQGEQGLLGIAVHPTFPTDPRVFVSYTDTNADSIVASLTLDPDDANRLDPDSRQQLLFIDDPYPNHNGGALAFGPDGYLYASFGDGGAGGDPQGNGQRLDTFLGKILRLDVDGGETYLIPDDNPFAAGGGLPEIWLYGLRNPWRMSFDRETGDLWMGDVGQAAWEEVDVARAGVGGINFGWVVMEGSHCYGGGTCDQEGLTLPVAEYGRDQGCTIIGGYVYRGDESAFLQGTYLFTDYCSGNLFAIDASASDLTAPAVVGNGSSGIAAFGEDNDGELYTLALDGAISRVVATEQ